MNYYELTINIPYFTIPDWFISVWLIVGGIGIMLQQFSIALVGNIKIYNKTALTLKNLPILIFAYILMLAFPLITYYAIYKHWRKSNEQIKI